jgi:protein-S-isoprenylcysteine O-methyltransferase Ste14
MTVQHIPDRFSPVSESSAPERGDAEVRELAVKQVERKRKFQMRAFAAAVVSAFLVVVWAVSEYNNAGGWPSNGFSNSSSIPHVWNDWIIYPLVLIGLGVAIDAWNTYRRKPISEAEIKREMDRLTARTEDVHEAQP